MARGLANYRTDYPAGTVLFRQGDPAGDMYVVQSGKVEISREVDGRHTVLAVLPPGEFFGEMSIINNSPRSATAKVVSDAQLLTIDAGTLEAMIRGSAEIAVRLIKKLAARLDNTTKQVELLMLRDPNSRVIHSLRHVAKSSGKPNEAGVAIDMTDELLAERVGLTTEEVKPVIERLERARLLTRGEGGRYVIAEVGKLQDFLDFLDMRDRYGT